MPKSLEEINDGSVRHNSVLHVITFAIKRKKGYIKLKHNKSNKTKGDRR